jgi:hypothetical protein
MQKKFGFVLSCLILIGSVLFVFILGSCNTLKVITGAPLWVHGEYANNSGEALGKYFVEWSGEIPASYSNSANENASAVIKNFRVSEVDGVTFVTHRMSWYPDLNNTVVKLTITEGDVEQQFSGSWNAKAIVAIPYTDDLLNILLKGEISMRLEDNRQTYQFNLPDGFPKAWSRRADKTNF